MDAFKFETTEPAEVCEETREWIPSGSTQDTKTEMLT